MVGAAYNKIQIVSCCHVQKLHLMELAHRLTNIQRYSEVGGIWAQEPFRPSSEVASDKLKYLYEWM